MVNKISIHDAICTKIHRLYEKKNADYGDSFSQLRKRYPNFVCMRIFDKLNRLETIMQPDHELKVTDETIEDTLMDIANYAVMEIVERQAEKLEPTSSCPMESSKPANTCCCDEQKTGLLSKEELIQKLSDLKKKLGEV